MNLTVLDLDFVVLPDSSPQRQRRLQLSERGLRLALDSEMQEFHRASDQHQFHRANDVVFPDDTVRHPHGKKIKRSEFEPAFRIVRLRDVTRGATAI